MQKKTESYFIDYSKLTLQGLQRVVNAKGDSIELFIASDANGIFIDDEDRSGHVLTTKYATLGQWDWYAPIKNLYEAIQEKIVEVV